jgi:hypothetical protein
MLVEIYLLLLGKKYLWKNSTVLNETAPSLYVQSEIKNK